MSAGLTVGHSPRSGPPRPARCGPSDWRRGALRATVRPMSEPSVSPVGPGGAEPAGVVDDAEPMSMGRRAGRVLAVVVAVGIAALWAYALWGPTEKSFP